MNLKQYIPPVCAAISLLVLSCSTVSLEEITEISPDGVPVEMFESETTMMNWLVVGPFPSQSSSDRLADGTFSIGYGHNYFGGVIEEGENHIAPGPMLYHSSDGTKDSSEALTVQANPLGIVDLAMLYNNVENTVAYAFTYLYSNKAQQAHAMLGSDDAVKVWVNGSLVHENYAFRGVVPGDDRFDIDLKKGYNTVLIKVLNGVRGWGFTLSAIDGETYARRLSAEKEWKEFSDFLQAKVVPDWDNYWDVTFTPGEFPKMRWDQPYLADKVIGKVPLNLRWFDAEMNEVTRAEKPGRYGYIAECISKDGKNIKRAGTLYCFPWDWMGWSERPYVSSIDIPGARFEAPLNESQAAAVGRDVGRIVLLSTLDQTEGASLMSYLNEVEQGKYSDQILTSPLLATDEYHIALQKKVGGINYSGNTLGVPVKRAGGPTQILRKGTPEEAGFDPRIVSELDALCEEWFYVSKEPFITLVARNGIIVYEAATGHEAGRDFTLDTATPVASVTKLITGVTFAQYVHQGLINIDDPVGKYFPEFPVQGDKALTLRHCFTHTSGLIGHESWGGVHNHRLENLIANQLEFLPVGTRSTYNGDGYNLAGRVMESVSEKSIFRVIHENLIMPLGLKNSSIEEDLAFSFQSTAGDLAVIGQMLLNRGSYGDYEFFSQEVFEQILPTNLSKYYSGMDWDQGIGLTWMSQRHPEAGKHGVPHEKMILSDRIIGHGSATSTVLQVDLENNLVITQSRRQGGAQFDEYLTKLLLIIEKNLR